VDAPFTAYAEAFRSLRNTLTISSGKPFQVVALVSSLPGEGKTTTSLSLARMMAMSGERTLIIDADPRGAGLLRLLPDTPDVGLVEVLDERADLNLAIQPDIVENLDILPVSSSTFVQSDVFSKERVEALIAELRGRYDRIVFDTPPLLGVADARIIAKLVDAVMLVVRWDSTPSNAIRSTFDILNQDQAAVIGALYTMVDPRSEAAGAAHYSTYYSSYLQPA
jgi:capsular exopolysaccharide synthesis family protein